MRQYERNTPEWKMAEEEHARLIACVPEMLEALIAIKARLCGEWDNPALVKLGPLGNEKEDILILVTKAIAKTEGRIVRRLSLPTFGKPSQKP